MYWLERESNIRKVFDATEWPFPVEPELTDLGIHPGLEREMKEKYPNLYFNRACLADGNILIQDIEPLLPRGYPVGGLNKQLRELNRISTHTLHVVDGMELTRNLLEVIEPSIDQLKDSLVVYPGNGARMVFVHG